MRSWHCYCGGGINDKWPIVVAKKLYDKPFFQGVLQRGGFDGFRIIIQDEDTFVHAQTVFSCKAMPHTKEYYDDILDRLQIIPDNNYREDRLFITRTKSDSLILGRLLENSDAISDLCRRYGFKTIDPGAITFDKQIDMFSKCRYLIGVHGAGMTNMIYRRDRGMSVIEIFPLDNIAPHYYWLSEIFGYSYDAIVGDKLKKGDICTSFTLDPEKLERKIKSFFSL